MHNADQEEKSFLAFYKHYLSQFLIEKKLKIKKDYSRVKIENDFNTQNIEGKDTSSLKLEDLQDMDLLTYGSDIVSYLLKNANSEQKDLLLSDKYCLFYDMFLIEATYKQPEDIKTVFKHLEKSILKSWTFKHGIEFLQKYCDNDLYDELIDIALSDKKSQLKQKKNKIFVNLMLNHVKNDQIYNKYNSLIPNNEVTNDVFESLELNYFELNVSKEKLFSSIILPSKDQYNNMHEFFVKKINEEKIKNMLGIVEIEGEVKYKSSKYFRYVFRVKENSLLDNDNAKLLVMSVYKLYHQTINNIAKGQYEYLLLNDISSEMIHDNYLNYKLSKKTNKTETIKEKKNKI